MAEKLKDDNKTSLTDMFSKLMIWIVLLNELTSALIKAEKNIGSTESHVVDITEQNESKSV